MNIRVAVAGFGPFPGVPKNPSGEIVRAISNMARFRASGVFLDTAIFETAYGDAERALQKLIAQKPDAIVLFGVAGSARQVRVETIARNRVSLLFPDRVRFKPADPRLSPDGPSTIKVRGPAMRMRAAIRGAGVKAELSVNAGSYLCNAVFYRALTGTAFTNPAPLTFFIHVPRVKPPAFPLRKLIKAGEAAVWTAAREAAKNRIVPRRDG